MDLDPDRLLRGPFVVGLTGSIVALRWVPGITLLERLFNALAGTAVAAASAAQPWPTGCTSRAPARSARWRDHRHLHPAGAVTLI